MIDSKELLNDLVRSVGQSRWYDAGKLLTKLEVEVPVVQPEGSWLEVAMSATKLNRNMLRKMQRVAKFADDHDKALRKGLISSPLSHVEVIAKAIELDRSKGLSLLDTYLNSGLPQSYRGLLDQYEKIRSSAVSLGKGKPAKTREATGEFRKICLDLIHGETMLEIYTRICRRKPLAIDSRVWKGAHPLTSPYATIRRPRGAQLIWHDHTVNDATSDMTGFDGVECFMRYEKDELDVVRRRLLQAATEASLYNVFWLFLPVLEATGERISFMLDGEAQFDDEPDQYIALHKRLAVPNLGIVVVDPMESAITQVALPYGNPTPDRRHLWNTRARQYLA